MHAAKISLDDRYERREGAVHMTGTQALVRLAMNQRIRDAAAGLDTACYISGYRGSPMHNVDKELWRAERFLEGARIHFAPAVNEDLAATAIWGTQQVAAMGDARHDGVYSLWYGKGPGIDRSMDAIRHAHMAGSAAHGGVLVAVGDDHALTSTSAPAAHEYAFVELMMPFLYPATVQEVVEFGLYGWALSRFYGGWVGFKLVPETVDTSSAVSADPAHPEIVLPGDVERPPGGLNLRIPDLWLEQEPRHRDYKLPAALAFARANRLNRVTVASRRPRYGIIATGKAWTDVGQALAELGIDAAAADELGITVLKLGMPHPFDAETARRFADGLEEVLVVEEKVDLTETRLRSALYGLPDGRRPRVVGRLDGDDRPLLPACPEIGPEAVSLALARRISHFHDAETVRARVAFIEGKRKAAAQRSLLGVSRTPYFCSGCPHNTSTRVPAGSRAIGGVGCHYMATYMDRGNVTYTQMGAEGTSWIGQAPFSTTGHVFQNLGDGTYYHSGLLAIRACIAAKVNITYKILFNDAVAMTGGQPVDGPLSPQRIARQVRAEGVERIHVVSDEPDKYPARGDFPRGTRFAHRKRLDGVQRECREHRGVSVIIYDQTCAAEKRRRRKRGDMVDPARRLFINERVCEGCGDCSTASNCLSVVPVSTPWGRKRRIDQSSCNKDYACVEGFCPSFVSVHGAGIRRAGGAVAVPPELRVLPEPERPRPQRGRPYSILVTGVGGTGVVTIGALLTMAAHIEGTAFSAVDQFGMAQKGGAVTSHLRLAARDEDIHAVRLNAGAADLVLGCDSLVAAGDLALNVMAHGRTRVVMNTHEQITGQFTRDPDLDFPAADVTLRVRAAAGPDGLELVDATALATRLVGDAIASNLFMLGYAYQRGLVPVSAAGIEQAIELNGVAVEMNRQAFAWGRRAARDPATVARLAGLDAAGELPRARPDEPLDVLVDRLAAELGRYQSAAWAARYRQTVEEARRAEAGAAPGRDGLGRAVATAAYKLMAYKDEYEVARLYTDGEFERRLREQFTGDFRLELHLAPPGIARLDPRTGHPAKRTFGPWAFKLLRALAAMRRLRGTRFDPFGRSAERRAERALIGAYERTVSELAQGLTAERHDLAVAIASIPERIRGFGHVKEESLARAREQESELLARWRAPESSDPASLRVA